VKQTRYRIGKVAELVGVSPSTIRALERRGEIPKAERTRTGYRVYRDEQIIAIRIAVYGPKSKSPDPNW